MEAVLERRAMRKVFLPHVHDTLSVHDDELYGEPMTLDELFAEWDEVLEETKS